MCIEKILGMHSGFPLTLHLNSRSFESLILIKFWEPCMSLFHGDNFYILERLRYCSGAKYMDVRHLPGTLATTLAIGPEPRYS